MGCAPSKERVYVATPDRPHEQPYQSGAPPARATNPPKQQAPAVAAGRQAIDNKVDPYFDLIIDPSLARNECVL